MELYQIRYFLSLCELLNFTKAANACNISQPALTRGIQKLEEEFGGPLFERDGKRTHMSPLARQIMPMLTEVYAGAAKAQDQAKKFLKLENAVLDLGVMCTIGPSRLLPSLRELRAQHPGIQLNLHEASTEDLIKEMELGKLEAVLAGFPLGVPKGLDAIPLYNERFVIAFPPGHRFEALTEVPFAELDQEDYLTRTGCEYISTFRESMRKIGIALNIVYRSPREEWVQNMVLAGMGIALMPEYIVPASGPPVRPVVSPIFRRQIQLFTIAGRSKSPSLQALIGILSHCETSPANGNYAKLSTAVQANQS